MNTQEIRALVGAVHALCPAQKFDEYTPDAWAMVLGEFSLADCREVLPTVGQGRAFIAPTDIATAVKELRTRRLDAANLIYEPQPDETPDQMRHRMRELRRAAADGNVIPLRPALTGPSTPAAIPTEIGRIVTERREKHAERRQLLAVRCPWCGAAPGVPCEIPNLGGDRRAQQLRSTHVHPSRAEAARATTEGESR